MTDSTFPYGSHSLLRNTREVFRSGCASPKTNQGQGMGGQAPSRGLMKPPPGPWITCYQHSTPSQGTWILDRVGELRRRRHVAHSSFSL